MIVVLLRDANGFLHSAHGLLLMPEAQVQQTKIQHRILSKTSSVFIDFFPNNVAKAPVGSRLLWCALWRPSILTVAAAQFSCNQQSQHTAKLAMRVAPAQSSRSSGANCPARARTRDGARNSDT